MSRLKKTKQTRSCPAEGAHPQQDRVGLGGEVYLWDSMIYHKSLWGAQIDTQHLPLRQARRKKYEGRGEKRRGVTRTDEARKWDARPRGEVTRRGIETLIAEALANIKPTDPVRLAKQTARRTLRSVCMMTLFAWFSCTLIFGVTFLHTDFRGYWSSRPPPYYLIISSSSFDFRTICGCFKHGTYFNDRNILRCGTRDLILRVTIMLGGWNESRALLSETCPFLWDYI